MKPIALNYRKDADSMVEDKRQTFLAEMFTCKTRSVWRFKPRNQFGNRCGEDIYVNRKVYLGMFAWFTPTHCINA